jgi:hypothetical protein
VFVACRHIADSLKVSLHESGRWRLAFTESYVQSHPERLTESGDRAAVKWARPPEAQPGWTHALSVVVPVRDLWRPDPPYKMPTKVRWREPPTQGMESHFAIFFERASGLTARRPAGDVVGTFYLPNGENLWIIAADVITLAENASRYEESRANIRSVPGGGDVGNRAFVFGDRPDGARVIMDLYPASNADQ